MQAEVEAVVSLVFPTSEVHVDVHQPGTTLFWWTDAGVKYLLSRMAEADILHCTNGEKEVGGGFEPIRRLTTSGLRDMLRQLCGLIELVPGPSEELCRLKQAIELASYARA